MKKTNYSVYFLILCAFIFLGCSSSINISARCHKHTISKTDLINVLSSCNSYELDSAGGSLKSVRAAANLVEFSAQNLTSKNQKEATAYTKEWYDDLSTEQKNNLKANWTVISSDVNQLITDPSSMTDLLDTAGVTTDFSSMDLTNGALLSDILGNLIK